MIDKMLKQVNLKKFEKHLNTGYSFYQFHSNAARLNLLSYYLKMQQQMPDTVSI